MNSVKKCIIFVLNCFYIKIKVNLFFLFFFLFWIFSTCLKISNRYFNFNIFAKFIPWKIIKLFPRFNFYLKRYSLRIIILKKIKVWKSRDTFYSMLFFIVKNLKKKKKIHDQKKNFATMSEGFLREQKTLHILLFLFFLQSRSRRGSRNSMTEEKKRGGKFKKKK